MAKQISNEWHWVLIRALPISRVRSMVLLVTIYCNVQCKVHVMSF